MCGVATSARKHNRKRQNPLGQQHDKQTQACRCTSQQRRDVALELNVIVEVRNGIILVESFHTLSGITQASGNHQIISERFVFDTFVSTTSGAEHGDRSVTLQLS